jgi:hypothetical protein
MLTKIHSTYILRPALEYLSKCQAFYEILIFNSVILTNFYLKEIWPFFIFQDLAFFETAYGQIWPF